MTLVRLLRGGRVTLPAKVRQKLKLAQGDYLEAEVVDNGVLLRPVSDVEREKAWQRVLDAPKSVRYIGPEPRPSPEERRSGWRRRSKPPDWRSMPTVVVDTTVLISGFVTPDGVAAKLLEQAHAGAFRLCLSPEIIEELRSRLLHRSSSWS